MIDIPYIIAELFPPPFFRKKLTVIGMMGHTQGVRMATKPPSSPNRNMVQRAVGSVGVASLALLVVLVSLVVIVALVSLVTLVSLVVLVSLVILV